jgi:hypothetical protein
MIRPTAMIDHLTGGVQVFLPIDSHRSFQPMQLPRLDDFFQILGDEGKQGSDDLDCGVFP